MKLCFSTVFFLSQNFHWHKYLYHEIKKEMLEYKIFREARRKLKLSLICHCSNWTLRLIHMWTKALYSALFEISQNAAICYDILHFQPPYYRWRSVSFSIVAGEFESLVPQVHQNYNEHSPSLWHNPVSIPLPPSGAQPNAHTS